MTGNYPQYLTGKGLVRLGIPTHSAVSLVIATEKGWESGQGLLLPGMGRWRGTGMG